MDDGLAGDFALIYDGVNAPSLTQYVVGGSQGKHPIVPGRGYRLKIAARAFNGLGSESTITTIFACSRPQGLAAPRQGLTESTSMILTWEAPLSDGACPITGYTLFMDDGITGAPATAVTPMASDIPTLRQVVVALDTAQLGTTYTFELRATNGEGTTASPQVSFLFAISPSQPPSGPSIVSTSSSVITLRYDHVLVSDGGSPVTSYHLQYIGDYYGGKWTDLSGASLDSLLTTFSFSDSLKRGETYSFRYRAKNLAGWSDFSDITSRVAADPPGKPASAPVIVGDPTAAGVTLKFELETIDDGGSPVTSYSLEKCQDTSQDNDPATSLQEQCVQDS